MASFSPIQSGGESTTSSTSGMSVTGSTQWSENGSHESSRVTMFIGDIDEVELQVQEFEHVREISGCELPQEDGSVSSDDENTITYDSVMEEIRRDIWEQVRKSKMRKRGRKKSKAKKTESAISEPNSQQQMGNTFYEELAVVEAVKDNLENERSPKLNQELPEDLDCPEDETSSKMKAARETIDRRKKEKSSLGSSPALVKENAIRSERDTVPALGTVKSEDIWDIQDDIGSMIIDEVAVQRGVRELEISELQEMDADSIFQSILDLELENDESVKTQNRSPLPTAPSPESNMVLKAAVFGSRAETMLYIPVSLIEEREIEMRQRAFEKGIGHEQWTRSLLYRKVRSARSIPHEGVLTVELHPETDCAKAKYSQLFLWQSWLNECIESFYKTGTMRIPDCSVGSDILITLQYFGILFEPEQLTFDSFETYLRLKHWSEYFMHRGAVTAWLLSQVDARPENRVHVFSTSPFSEEKGVNIWLENVKMQVLDGGITLDKKIYGRTSSCNLVFSFFNDDDDDVGGGEGGDDWNIGTLMREDFCDFLQGVAPDIVASFSIKTVIISHASGVCENMKLAVLCIGCKKELNEELKGPSEEPELKGDEAISHTSFMSGVSEHSEVSGSVKPRQSKLTACNLLGARAKDYCPIQQNPKEGVHGQIVNLLDASALKSCQIKGRVPYQLANLLDASALDACTVQQNPKEHVRSFQADSEDLSSMGPKLLKSKKRPEKVQPAPTIDEAATINEASTIEEEDSGILDGWMSTYKKKAEASVFQDMIREGVTSPNTTSGGKVAVDHIYADLLLQDTEFFDGWENSVAAADEYLDKNELKPSLRVVNVRDPQLKQQPIVGKANGVAHDNRRHQKQPITTSNHFALEREAMKYKPKDFVCDVVGLFETTNENDSGDKKVVPQGQQQPDVAALIRQHKAKYQQHPIISARKSNYPLPEMAQKNEKRTNATSRKPLETKHSPVIVKRRPSIQATLNFADFDDPLAQSTLPQGPVKVANKVSAASTPRPKARWETKKISPTTSSSSGNKKNTSRHIKLVPNLKLGALVKRTRKKSHEATAASPAVLRKFDGEKREALSNDLIPGVDFPDDEGM